MNFYFDIFSFINSSCHVLFKNVFLSNGRLTGILYLVFLKFKLGPKKLLDEIVRLACEDLIYFVKNMGTTAFFNRLHDYDVV